MEWASTLPTKVDSAVNVDHSTTAVPPMNCHTKPMDIGMPLAIALVKDTPLLRWRVTQVSISTTEDCLLGAEVHAKIVTTISTARVFVH